MNWQSIFNPFCRYSEKQLFVIGFIFLILNASVCFFTKTQMDSISHFTDNNALSLQNAVLFVVISCTTATIFLYVLALIINTKTRFIDIVTTILISQVPNFCILLFIKFSGMNEIAKNLNTRNPNAVTTIDTSYILILFASSMIILALIFYSFVLLYNGFKTATNFKKWYHIVLFVTGLLFFILIHQLYLPHLLNN